MTIIESLPLVNPLKFHLEAGGAGFFYNDIPRYEDQVCYTQKYLTTDTVKYQFFYNVVDDTGGVTLACKLVDADGVQVGSAITISNVTVAGGPDDVDWKKFSKALTGLTEGEIYYFILTITDDVSTREYISEPIEIIGTDVETILLTYTNSRNAFDIYFPDTDATFNFRVEGGFWSDGYSPASKDTVYSNQSHDLVLLNSVPYNVEKITFGDSGGVPNWVADKINRIFACDSVMVDGVQYCKNEGAKMEGIREKGQPMSGWNLEILKSDNSYSL